MLHVSCCTFVLLLVISPLGQSRSRANRLWREKWRSAVVCRQDAALAARVLVAEAYRIDLVPRVGRRNLSEQPKGGYRKLTFAHVRQAKRCVRCTFQGSFSVFSISKWEIDTYQNGLGYMSDTYPNPYHPVTVPPL